MTPDISIIIPVYNVARYLRQCLDSAANQSHRDIEIVCIDDGSTDSSGAILDEYAAADSRFVVVHQANSGQSAARNRGICIARGEYIAFLDSDDWYDRDLCAKSLQIAVESKADIVLFFHNSVDCPNRRTRFHKIRADLATDEFEKVQIVRYCNSVIWNQLYRKAFLDENHIRFLEGHVFEDTHFSLKAAILANGIALLKEKLYYYRYGSGYSTDRAQIAKRLKMLDMYVALLEDIRKIHPRPQTMEYLWHMKLSMMRSQYRKFSGELRKEFRSKLLESLTEEDLAHIRGRNRFLPPVVRSFYYHIRGQRMRAAAIFLFFTLLEPRRLLR
jgi:glycosyltransferase involved in cell wall biosynthesis